MARRFAYLTPDTDGTQTIVSRCLSVPLPLLPYVVGALSELTNVWQWEQFGTMLPEDAAQLAAVMLNDFSEDCAMNCEELLLCLAQSPLNSAIPDDALLRVENGQPQYSYDGTNWLDVYGDASADPIGRPLTATTGADSDARICLAATRAMLVLAETYKGVYGAVTADIYNASNRFANWLNNFNRWLSGIVWPEAAWITQSELLRTNALPENYTAGELTTEAKQDLLCLLVEYATDNAGVVTFDWGAIRDNTIATLGNNPGVAVWSIIVYLKNRGIEIASNTPITDTAWDCATCVDSGVWCRVWDFRAAGTNLGWGTNGLVTWNNQGDGFAAGAKYWNSGLHQGIWPQPSWAAADTRITRVEFLMKGSGILVGKALNGDGPGLTNADVIPSSEAWVGFDVDPAVFGAYAYGYNYWTGATAGNAWSFAARLYGTGTPPITGSEC